MRKVRSPHQVLDAYKMARYYSDAIVLKRRCDLASKIIARWIRERFSFEVSIFLKRMVEALEKVRNPADVVLDRHEPEFRKPFQHTGEDNFGERPLDRTMQHCVAFHQAEQIAAAAPLSEDVQADGRF